MEKDAGNGSQLCLSALQSIRPLFRSAPVRSLAGKLEEVCDAKNDPEELKLAEETAKAYAKSGIEAAIRRRIELQMQLAKRRYVDPADIGYNYAELGEKDQAFLWMEKAYAEKSDDVAFIKVSRSMASLRSDPRYAALLKKMGLPQ